MDIRELILAFIKKHKIGVISTVSSEGGPEAAVIEFAETEELELIFDTLNTSRKYKNLQTNQRVAFVIGWDEDITVQYEGVVKELAGKELEEAQAIYFHKDPEAKRWATREGIRYFKVTPTWIRYSDLNTYPWRVEEVSF